MTRRALPPVLAATALAALGLACHGNGPVGPIPDPVVAATTPLVVRGGPLGEHVGLEVVIQRDAAGTSLGLMTVSGFVLENFGYRAYALVTPLGVPCPADVFELVVAGGGPTHDFGGTIPVPATPS